MLQLPCPVSMRDECNNYKYGRPIPSPMAKKNDGGFQSQAGLVRYFDTENDKSVKLSPKLVVGIAVVFSIAVIILNTFFPVN